MNYCWTYYRKGPLPRCHSCGERMDYWVPGLEDEKHEHPACAGARIAQQAIEVFNLIGNVAIMEDE